MIQDRSVLAKTRTYLYLIFVCEFVSLFARQINDLTGFDLKRIVFGFIALIAMQLIVVVMYNLKFTMEVTSRMSKTPAKKGQKKKKNSRDDILNDMLTLAARIRVFMIVTGVILIIQALAFQFVNEPLMQTMLIISEITCLILSLQSLTKLERM
ncbi:MAG: hypothetical protein ACI4KJ_03835 [Anaerovoracaceae bacterium]